MNLKSPYFVALDIDDKEVALDMAKKISPFVGGFKVGPRLGFRYGASFISQLAELAPVFADNKYYDIPSTMEAAVRASFDAGASFCTIHAGSGLEAMKKIAHLENELSSLRPFKILAVTVLTSFNEKSLPSHWANLAINDHVCALAKDVELSGLSGLVCSPQEADQMRRMFPKCFIVTPGVRLGKGAAVMADDQERVMSPEEAISKGASALVIGRPIVQAEDPVAVAKKIYDLLK